MMAATLRDLTGALPADLHERTRLVMDRNSTANGSFVLYWMRTALRFDDNPALNVAIEFANRLGKSVLIYHALSERYPYANDRHHTFILEAARDLQAKAEYRFADHGPTYAFHLERQEQRGPYLRILADQAAVVITEDMPVEPLRRWTSMLARKTQTPVLAVDTACVVPMQVVGKAYERAFAFRNATKKDYAQRLGTATDGVKPLLRKQKIDLPFKPINLQTADLGELVSQCQIDHSIGPVSDTVGGSEAGYTRWEAFKEYGLASYARKRNDALIDGTSRMSAYFHYGMVSPMRIAAECAALDHAGADKYLDELLIWRELAYVFCFYRPDHGRLSALPNWATKTLQDHETDERPALFSWETLARGETGDPLWDAAQRSLLIHGELHNNVRMTWGKALLRWTANAKEALAMTIDLNHRYALDGRDPASYGGILWCFGQFDRPFPPEQPIFGTVRTRSTHQHGTRLDPGAYAKKTTRTLRAPMPNVAVVGAGISGLACARTLADHGFPVTVFEKSRGVGGRMSTRRVTDGGQFNNLQFDHGAQYFTARDPRFRRYVTSWQQDALARRWEGKVVVLADGGQETKRGTDRFVAVPGMNAIGKHLARDLELRLHTQVEPLIRDEQKWHLKSASGLLLGDFDIAVVSTPAPQAAALLVHSPALATQAATTIMNGCWAVMVSFSSPLDVEFDAAFVHNSPISWIARNSSKPLRASLPETWVVHASAAWTEEHIEDEPSTVQKVLLDEFSRATSTPQQKPAFATAHRWRYAIPSKPSRQVCLFDPEQMIGACGDWCAGPRVEGAFLSGMALAGRVMGLLKHL